MKHGLVKKRVKKEGKKTLELLLVLVLLVLPLPLSSLFT
jgi:hypothetical protein